MTTQQETRVSTSFQNPDTVGARERAFRTTHNASEFANALEPRKESYGVQHRPGRHAGATAEHHGQERLLARPVGRPDKQQVLEWFGDLTQAEAQTLFELLAKVEHRARTALRRIPTMTMRLRQKPLQADHAGQAAVNDPESRLAQSWRSVSAPNRSLFT